MPSHAVHAAFWKEWRRWCLNTPLCHAHVSACIRVVFCISLYLSLMSPRMSVVAGSVSSVSSVPPLCHFHVTTHVCGGRAYMSYHLITWRCSKLVSYVLRDLDDNSGP